MQIKIINENKELVIVITKEAFKDVEKEIQLCLNGSYTYVNIIDEKGKIHYITSGFLKNSYVTISDENTSHENDTL